jgi:hypothetical protein
MTVTTIQPPYSVRNTLPEWDLPPIHITRLVVEAHEASLGDVQAVVFDDPMSEHVHPRTCASGSPELAIDDPLLLTRPLGLRKQLLRQCHGAVVGCRVDVIEEPDRCRDHAARAGGKERLDF